jgi:hypothetical protein
LIDDQAGQTIGLTKNQPAGLAGTCQMKYLTAKADCVGDPRMEEIVVESSIGTPAIKANTNLALAVVKTAGNEIACMRIDVYFITVF